MKMDNLKKNVQIRGGFKVILLWTSLLQFGWCLEEFQREIFLGPRNFNPHPYEYQLAKIQDPGPVLFPRNEDEEDSSIPNKYNIITLNSVRSKHPVDDNPYTKVTQKLKYLLSTKFSSNKDIQIDNEIYDALAVQGEKVLHYPPQELKNYGRSSQFQKKNYAFAYKVIDKATGDDFSHQQFRNSKATNGEYRVKLPDGRIQIVSYKADKNGYNADVKYEEDPQATNHQVIQSPLYPAAQEYIPQNVHVNKASVRELTTGRGVNFANKYDFIGHEDEQQLLSPLRNPNLVVLEQSGPTQIPLKYIDVAVSSTPSPSHLISEPQRIQTHHFPNVQIYTTNPRDYLKGNYVPTTAATPAYENNAVRYTSTPVPPTVQAHASSSGDNRLFKLNVVSTYASPAHNGSPGHKNVINTVVPSNNPNDAYRHTLEQENELPEGIYIVGKSGKR